MALQKLWDDFWNAKRLMTNSKAAIYRSQKRSVLTQSQRNRNVREGREVFNTAQEAYKCLCAKYHLEPDRLLLQSLRCGKIHSTYLYDLVMNALTCTEEMTRTRSSLTLLDPKRYLRGCIWHSCTKVVLNAVHSWEYTWKLCTTAISKR